jgi:uncharacterized protein
MNTLLLEQLLSNANRDVLIENVYIFLNWVIVKTDKYAMSTMLTGMPGLVDPTGMNTFVGDIIGKNAYSIAKEYLTSTETLKRAVGMATLKGILPDVQNYKSGNAIDFYKHIAAVSPTCFIGHFNEGALWRAEGYPVSIVELFPRPGDIHWDNSHSVLENAELVLMTGLTIVNNTFDEVVKRTPNAKYRVVMGPTVPLSPVLFEYGITTIGGTLIRNHEITIKYCQHGGGSIAYAPEGALEKVTISI